MTQRPVLAILLLIAMIFPLSAEAQSPQTKNNDGEHASCTVYSTIVEHPPDLTLARVDSTEVGTKIRINTRTPLAICFGVREEKRFAPGTLVQPPSPPHRIITMTITWH